MNDLRGLVDTILSQADIVSVISAYLPVIKKGRNYVCVCPFHDDHHPSMSISKERQLFKCFSCGAGGNAITFVQRFEKISYPEAVKKVAELSGIKDDRLDSLERKAPLDPRLEALHKCINDLERFYQYGLTTAEGEEARKYLAERKISQEDIAKYGIGYSLLDGEKTIAYLTRLGHSVKSIEDIGISLAKASGMRDQNAGRLIFPLFDPSGQVVGFSARLLLKDSDLPKYVNSPETPIFKKGKLLYNYHNVRPIARQAGYVYLLEGFMDVMALDRSGIPSALALMGTSLTSDQIDLLRRLGVEVRLSLDGDEAGQKGMMKIIGQLLKAAIPFRLVSNPGDLRDPDDIYEEEGKAGVIAKMNNLVDPFAFQVEYYSHFHPLKTPEERSKVMHYFLPQLRALPPGLERENTIIKLAKATGYEKEAIRDEINKLGPGKRSEEETEAIDEVDYTMAYPQKVFQKRLHKAEREILYYMLKYPEAVDYFQKNIDHFDYPEYDELANYVIEYGKLRGKETPVSLPLLVGDIESDDSPDRENLLSALSSLSEEDFHPSFSKKALLAASKAIAEEKEKLYEDHTIKEELEKHSLDPKAQAKLLEDYAKERRLRLKKKGR